MCSSAGGGEVSVPCREMIDLSHYTFLYGSIRLRLLGTHHARFRRKSYLAEHGIEVEGV